MDSTGRIALGIAHTNDDLKLPRKSHIFAFWSTHRYSTPMCLVTPPYISITQLRIRYSVG